MKVVAHRGACTEELENSWAAFRKAVEIGADRIELDVHLTADNQLAIIHDADLKRTAGIDKNLRDMTRKEIKETVKLSNGDPLPFLDEVVDELLEKIEINVEIKTEGVPVVEAVGRMLNDHKLSEKIIISSFNKNTCADSARLFKRLKVALLWDKYLWIPGSFQYGPVRFMEQHGIRIYHPEAKLLMPQQVKICKERSIQVVPWVGMRDETNREQLWSYLATVGVDGFCTNYPRQLKLWLEEARDDESRFKDSPLMVSKNPGIKA